MDVVSDRKDLIKLLVVTVGTGIISYWAFTRQEIIASIVGAFLCVAGIGVFLYTVMTLTRKRKLQE
ncbi:MAG: hypothetical protein QW128_04430 [Thermoprotei archaeon]